jgi:hypothetical protein
MKSMLAITFLVLMYGLALAGQGGGSPSDPFFTNPVPQTETPVINVTAANVLRSQTVNTSVRNLIIIAAGQSNIVNVAPSNYTPTNSTVLDNFDITSGAIYAAVDPLMGCNWVLSSTVNGNPMLRLADNLITAGKFDRIIIVPVALGGTSVAQWFTDYPSGRIESALNRIASHGIVAGTNVTIIVIWAQGETDNQNGTTQSTYTTTLNSGIAASRAAGFTGTWFVAEQTWLSGTTSAAVQAAQAAVVNHGSNVWAGPNADALNGSVCGSGSATACRQGDNTHFSDAGSFSDAAAWQAALHLFGAPF